MHKQTVDEIITAYIPKIFGFALTHEQNSHKAEELAARITCEVYESLLKSKEIHNINGYIYRISQNTYARFVHEETHGRSQLSINAMQLPSPHDFTTEIERQETHARLRKEISYMAGIQREILVLHYFDRLKQYEIAERLKIPIGTVKWHLHDARKQIKESITMRKNENLALKPVRFGNISHHGDPGGNPPDKLLNRSISQNIVYATYHQTRTITEIAELISTPAAFVEDEITYLEQHGFVEKQPGGKYQTTVCVHEGETPELENQLHELYMLHANMICEKYVPQLAESIKTMPNVYSPQGDKNYLLWSALTYATGRKFWLSDIASNIYNSRLYVKRPDGGEYITLAHIDDTFDWSKLNHDPNKYIACGNMNRYNDELKIAAWQLDTMYDSRTGFYMDNHTDDYNYLYMYIIGKLPKTAENVDKYKRLLDKGYLVQQNTTEYVNMTVTALSEEEFANKLPPMPTELKAASEELDDKFFDLLNLLSGHMTFTAALGNLIHPFDDINLPNSDILGPRVYGSPIATGFRDSIWSVGANDPYPNAFSIGVNQDIIRAIGAPNPVDLYNAGQWTWDAMLDIMRLATADTTGDGVLDRFGFAGQPGDFTAVFIGANDGILVTDDFQYATDHPNTIEALEFMEIMFREGHWQYDHATGADVGDWHTNFWVAHEGQAAMWQATAWALNGGDLPFDFNVVPFPTGPSNTSGSTGLGGWRQALVFPVASDWAREDLLTVIEEFFSWPGDEPGLIYEYRLGWARNQFHTEDDVMRHISTAYTRAFDIGMVIPGYFWFLGDFVGYFLNQEMTVMQAIESHRGPRQEMLDAFLAGD